MGSEDRIEYKKAYYKANKDKIKQKAKERYDSEKAKAYYEANKDKIKQKAKIRCKTNHERIKECKKTCALFRRCNISDGKIKID